MRASSSLVVVVAVLASIGCRDRKCDESIAAQAAASASAATKSSALDGSDDAELRSLCALLALTPPPERTPDHDWETSSIPTQTKGRFGWVRLTGETKKLKADDIETFLHAVEVARSKASPSVGSRACGRFRDDPQRRVVITVTFRTKGDATKGDYWNYVALGMGPNHPPGTRWVLWGVSEETAKLGALRQARILMGMEDADVSTLVDEWLGPNRQPPPR